MSQVGQLIHNQKSDVCGLMSTLAKSIYYTFCLEFEQESVYGMRLAVSKQANKH